MTQTPLASATVDGRRREVYVGIMTQARFSLLICLASALALAGCASRSGDACSEAGHAPGTKGYADCSAKVADDQAKATRRIANDVPLRGYGPIGRF